MLKKSAGIERETRVFSVEKNNCCQCTVRHVTIDTGKTKRENSVSGFFVPHCASFGLAIAGCNLVKGPFTVFEKMPPPLPLDN